MQDAFSKVLSASEILCSPKKYLNQKPLLEVRPTTLPIYSFQFMSAFQPIASLCRLVVQTNGYCPRTHRHSLEAYRGIRVNTLLKVVA